VQIDYGQTKDVACTGTGKYVKIGLSTDTTDTAATALKYLSFCELRVFGTLGATAGISEQNRKIKLEFDDGDPTTALTTQYVYLDKQPSGVYGMSRLHNYSLTPVVAASVKITVEDVYGSGDNGAEEIEFWGLHADAHPFQLPDGMDIDEFLAQNLSSVDTSTTDSGRIWLTPGFGACLCNNAVCTPASTHASISLSQCRHKCLQDLMCLGIEHDNIVIEGQTASVTGTCRLYHGTYPAVNPGHGRPLAHDEKDVSYDVECIRRVPNNPPWLDGTGIQALRHGRGWVALQTDGVFWRDPLAVASPPQRMNGRKGRDCSSAAVYIEVDPFFHPLH